MNCIQARACASDYLDGEVDPSIAIEVENHLQTCKTCPPLMAALIGLLAELRTLPERPPDPRWVDDTLARLVQIPSNLSVI